MIPFHTVSSIQLIPTQEGERARPYEDGTLVPLSGPKCMQVGMSRNWSVDHDQMIMSSRVVFIVVVVVIGEKKRFYEVKYAELVLHSARRNARH